MAHTGMVGLLLLLLPYSARRCSSNLLEMSSSRQHARCVVLVGAMAGCCRYAALYTTTLAALV